MADLPAPLSWLTKFSQSLEGALGSKLSYTLYKTTNPLIYAIKFLFKEYVSGERMLLIWNLLQIFAARNEAVPQGTVEFEGYTMTCNIIIKHRLGFPKETHPLDK